MSLANNDNVRVPPGWIIDGDGWFASGDLAPTIGTWLAEAGFEEVAMDAPDDTTYRVRTDPGRINLAECAIR